PEMGTQWLATILVQTGIKSDASQITGQYKPYFEELEALNANARFFVGIPQHHIKGQCAETFKQVMNAAFPAGQIDVDDAT
ncbi:MAG: ABC transporter substrate-binding protein, partial [Candidatus Competibacteraceae bacterium]|nr:ABC transporter substrate-binding protein [Candidatus Competibacteraceae bacterium]